MRLIDADALIETMKRVEKGYEDAMTRPSWWTAYSVISEQPTAYDTERVVAELEEETEVFTSFETMHIKYAIPKHKATDIVKRGGVE